MSVVATKIKLTPGQRKALEIIALGGTYRTSDVFSRNTVARVISPHGRITSPMLDKLLALRLCTTVGRSTNSFRSAVFDIQITQKGRDLLADKPRAPVCLVTLLRMGERVVPTPFVSFLDPYEWENMNPSAREAALARVSADVIKEHVTATTIVRGFDADA